MNDNNINSQTERIDYLDIARCIGIILMIMGHVGFSKRFAHFIHAFNMPMFFYNLWLPIYIKASRRSFL
ncbi:MAG: hypothetical protein SPJ04_04305 [Bdellovibrionota bacterium]|nr:hypothetical protein [Pseudomonadota bacterium]MDY6090458.1 hypothetical protein [Bdellovibrionota bacterium]